MSWKRWAVSEGVAKTLGGMLQKAVGLQKMGEGGAFLSILIVGTIQTGSGLIGHAVRSVKGSGQVKTLIPDVRSVLWAVAFGFFATMMPVLGIITFELDADLGVRTLIVVSSIVPGAILGKVVFNDPFGARDVSGIALFLVAVWAMLDFPGTYHLAPWVWISLLIMLMGAVNEVLARQSAVKLDPWVNNFWVGLSTMVWTSIGLALLLLAGVAFQPLSQAFVIGSVMFGFVTVAMIAFKLLAYKIGGSEAAISLKKLIMQGSYLVSATIAGILFFRESLTVGKVIGILLFFAAFAVTDRDAWRFVTARTRVAS